MGGVGELFPHKKRKKENLFKKNQELINKMQLSHKPFIMIALGGALGALSRFYLSVAIDMYALNFGQSLGAGAKLLSDQVLFASSLALFFSLFPLAILLINMLGSFALGFFLAYMQYTGKNNIPLRNFLVIGFLGSFTTFSTFIIDCIELIIPFLMQSVLLQQIFPHLEGLSYSLGTLFPLYTKELLLMHSLVLAVCNVFLNLILCIACVAVGHRFMQKRYSSKKG